MSSVRERLCLVAVLLLGLIPRAWRLDQPIVENYVGRQVPTAMVARNLQRGSGFLRPQLDTGPFPNLFLVEPPVFALATVGLHRATGLRLTAAGRLVSALGIMLGMWGLFGLVRRREGASAAFVAVLAFGFFPITIRYGRAVQGDALMLGAVIAALNCWDRREEGGSWYWLVPAWGLLALGLSLKVIAAYALIPLIVVIQRPRRSWKIALAISAVIPPLLWYVHAVDLLASGIGSRASAENGLIWLHVLVPSALFQLETYRWIGRFLVLRAFTPIGFLLAVMGFFHREERQYREEKKNLSRKAAKGLETAQSREKTIPLLCVLPLRLRDFARTSSSPDHLWHIWGLSAAAMLVVLAGKLHHEYYFLALAPVMSVGLARSWTVLFGRNPWLGTTLSAGLLIPMALFQTLDTWTTPAEWDHLPEAALVVQRNVPPDALLVAPEALLFQADRRGCRLEVGREAEERAAGEWGGSLEADSPIALLEFYRRHGARFIADLSSGNDDPRRRLLHEMIRQRYRILVDRPGVLLARLDVPAVP